MSALAGDPTAGAGLPSPACGTSPGETAHKPHRGIARHFANTGVLAPGAEVHPTMKREVTGDMLGRLLDAITLGGRRPHAA